MDTNRKTALVTGATSGLGFEAAAQLATLGYQVILAGRSLDKANRARQELIEKTGSDPFEVVVVDLDDNAAIPTAVEALAARGVRIDFLLLNAGLVSGGKVVKNDDGIEITVAASLVGHHVLTMGLLNEGLLADDARIVIAGSEAARGDVPMMAVTDLPAYASEHHEGDRVKAILDIARVEGAYAYKNMSHYANAKLFVAWWAAALARRLPSGITVSAVSPGSAPATGAMRHQSAFMKVMMTILFRGLGPLIGAAAPVPKAARRYIDAASYGPEANGGFYASAPGKMIGKVVRQTQPHVLDHDSQEALWQAVLVLSNNSSSTPLVLERAV